MRNPFADVEGGIGLPQSKTLRKFRNGCNMRQLLECGSLLPLFRKGTKEASLSFSTITVQLELISATQRAASSKTLRELYRGTELRLQKRAGARA
jgi:hypothetical protein